MYYLDYDVILDDGSVYNFSQSLDFTVAAYAKTKPVIDGTMRAGEWAANTAMFSENAEQIKLITDYGGITDLSARTNIMWDEDYMYMGVRVRDDISQIHIQPIKSGTETAYSLVSFTCRKRNLWLMETHM